MPAPSLFPPRQSINTNYDWINLVSATGYVLFDGTNAPNSAGNNYILIESTHSGSLIGGAGCLAPVGINHRYTVDVSGNGVGGTPGKGTDIDFDSSIFQLPRTIEGDAFVRVSLSGDGVAGNDPSNVYIVARLRKYSGSESEIALVTSATETDVTDSEETASLLKITVPRTHFKKGDHLRLTIEIWSESATTHKMDLAHNPDDTAVGQFSAGNSRLTLALPFKLDFM